MRKYNSLQEFYPYYLTQHADAVNRNLHFAGTTLAMLLLFWGLYTGSWKLLMLVPAAGYGFAWVGHFFAEKNKPATFRYPLYSLGSDFLMWWHMLNGTIDARLNDAKQKSTASD